MELGDCRAVKEQNPPDVKAGLPQPTIVPQIAGTGVVAGDDAFGEPQGRMPKRLHGQMVEANHGLKQLG